MNTTITKSTGTIVCFCQNHKTKSTSDTLILLLMQLPLLKESMHGLMVVGFVAQNHTNVNKQ